MFQSNFGRPPTRAQLAIARVAGFDRAVYGLPKDALSLLFTIDNGNCIVATTKLSNFVTGRYAPAHEWQVLWQTILDRLGSYLTLKKTNEAYDTGETPRIQSNDDKASDQLYTTGFSLFALHEAVATTHDEKLRVGGDKLTDYLCRIQTKSEKLPQYSGWWFRAFDFKRWDYWASSSDLAWGVRSLEAGWAQAWTAATLGLQTKQTNYWDPTSNSKIAQQLPIVRGKMAQNEGSPAE